MGTLGQRNLTPAAPLPQTALPSTCRMTKPTAIHRALIRQSAVDTDTIPRRNPKTAIVSTNRHGNSPLISTGLSARSITTPVRLGMPGPVQAKCLATWHATPQLPDKFPNNSRKMGHFRAFRDRPLPFTALLSAFCPEGAPWGSVGHFGTFRDAAHSMNGLFPAHPNAR
jgi:hypothetical protein